MTFRVFYTKAFNGCRRDLKSAGHKQATAAINAAIVEASTEGAISIPRTHHGESRLPDVEKYDLGSGFRLVVQLVDGAAKARAFLFAGSHDDAQRWLDNHRDYRWVRSKTDGTLDFVQVSYAAPIRPPVDRADLDATDDHLALPLLRDVTDEDWRVLGFGPEAMTLARAVTGHLYEQDAEGLLGKMDELAGYEKASLVFDLLSLAAARQWRGLRARLDLERGLRAVVPAEQLAAAMADVVNGDEIVTFDGDAEIQAVLAERNLSDWMLFLHPQQRRVVEREFNGPARLRGPSGSGKTSVLVHRARFLAQKYPGQILLVTLTESMRKLLDRLCDDLCGLERGRITTLTMAALVRQVLSRVDPDEGRGYAMVSNGQIDELVDHATRAIRQEEGFAATHLASLEAPALRAFVAAEIGYVRGRLTDDALDTYCDTHAFRRRGQPFPLDEAARRVVRVGLRAYGEELARRGLRDSEGMVASALALLRAGGVYDAYRCVLADEVQDLSQLEVGVLGALHAGDAGPIASAPDGLFLVGDGAQTIYRRGFSLRQAGLDITGRSAVLRRSYRNTQEILRAAFALVERYPLGEDDEAVHGPPLAPELAPRHGLRPTLLRCHSTHAELTAVAEAVQALVASGHAPGQICIISASRMMRDDIVEILQKLSVEVAELKSDVDYESSRVKLSTIESAKGHEFETVFIVGLVEGVISTHADPDGHARDAARLYVAMTRARESLCLSYAPTPRHPASLLLEAVQPHCDEAVLKKGKIRRLAEPLRPVALSAQSTSA